MVDDAAERIPRARWVALAARRAFSVGLGIAVFAFAVDMPEGRWDSATLTMAVFVAAITAGGAISGALAGALQALVDSPRMAALLAIATTGWSALALSPVVRIGDASWTSHLGWWLAMIGVPAALGMIVVLATPTTDEPARVS